MKPTKGTISMTKTKNGAYSYDPSKVLAAYTKCSNIPKYWCEIRKAELASALKWALDQLRKRGK